MDTMDFKLNREAIAAAQTALDSSCELPVERDFVLPDYYPDIFRVLKCTVSPDLSSTAINGGKLTIEIAVLIRVLYLSENDKRINCIEQKMTVSKSLEMNGECVNPAVYVKPKCDYVNCRVVNQRRLDVRGAVTASVKAEGELKQAVVTNAFGGSVQLKKQTVTYPARRLHVAKRITVIDEFEMSSSKPAVGAVLRCGCTVEQGDYLERKIIAGKLITKGEVQISMLYSCVNAAGEDSVETMRFSLPFSQIIDVDGIDESFDADVDISVGSCELIPKGENGNMLECELVLLVSCTAMKYETCEAVTDAYSTCYECEIDRCETQIECPPERIKQSAQAECTLTYSDGEIGCVYDSFAECGNITSRLDSEKKCFMLSGNVKFTSLGAGEGGMPFLLEAETPFEQEIPFPEGCEEELSYEPNVAVCNCSYYLAGGSSIELKADLKIGGLIRRTCAGKLISELRVLTDKPKKRCENYALKLCRCGSNEDIWDIAKKYSTSVTAIMEENELTDDKITQQGMLLIPLMS